MSEPKPIYISSRGEAFKAVALREVKMGEAVVIGVDVEQIQETHYSAQKRRLIAALEEYMAFGDDEFNLKVGQGEWVLSPIRQGRTIKR